MIEHCLVIDDRERYNFIDIEKDKIIQYFHDIKNRKK